VYGSFIHTIISIEQDDSIFSGGEMFKKHGQPSEVDPDDITAYPTARSIFRSGRFTPAERKKEYSRRGKGPAGVIDGEYNDAFCDPGDEYNDFERDWEADE
jgi:hypothetical protein